MKFFNDLERKYHSYAIKNLMLYITILYGIGIAIMMMPNAIYSTYLSLNVEMILQGQIWRLFTFLLYPPTFGAWSTPTIFWSFIMLHLYNTLGRALENMWGDFRFNVFYIMGVLFQIIAAFVVYFVFGENLEMTTGFINASIFLAFALYSPDTQVWLLFVLPVKVKWLAIAECGAYLYSFLVGGNVVKIELVISLLNLIVFFAITRNYKRYAPKEIKRRKNFKKQVKIIVPGSTRHKCAVCGRTEADEDLEFRYCSKCQGSYEYCQDHLYTHEHVVEKVPDQS